MLKKILTITLLLNTFLIGIANPHLVSGEGENTAEQDEDYDNYGVSAAHPAAVEAGMEVLENGGNAVDAAIAVSYALGVVEPFGSGIGGGGKMLILPPEEEDPVVYDYRAAAPYDDEWGDKITGVPGFVEGLNRVHNDYGLMPFEHLISPAIDLAEDGFRVDYLLWERLEAASYRLPVEELSHFYPRGEAIKPGRNLKQPELAETLTKIQAHGAHAFNRDQFGEMINNAVPYLDGSDLDEYEVELTEPVVGELKEGTIYSADPPHAGVSLVQSLLLAEEMNIEETKGDEEEYVHLMSEISKVTKRDRIANIGDESDSLKEELTSENHIEELADEISSDEPSPDIGTEEESGDDEKTDTTHFVVVDQDGMVVSTTNTLSNFFGSGEYTDGFFLNNSIQQFSEFESSPNSYEPGKRSRSLTAPSIYVDDERVVGIGSPGGNRVPSVMAQVLTRHLYFDEPWEDAVNAKRFYGESDILYVEEDFDESVLGALRDRGYEPETRNLSVFFGGIQALDFNMEDGSIVGIADFRRDGLWDAKDNVSWMEYAQYGLVGLFILSIIFPLMHIIHCLPFFRTKNETVNRILRKEKGMSILIPCYNEQGIIKTSLETIESLSYSNFEVLYINDGSTDKTLAYLDNFLQLKPSNRTPHRKLDHKKVKTVYQSQLYPHIYVVDKWNGGKADALNAGIEYASEDLVITLDADTMLTDQAMPKVNETFEDEDVVAAGGMVHVLQTKTANSLSRLSLKHTNLLVRLQMLDFLKAFYITKVSLARFNALAVISGAFGIFRRQALIDVGGYRSTVGEDIDITLRMQKYIAANKNKKVVHIKDAISYTEMPETVKDFFKQRVRWQKAYIDCIIHFNSFFAKTLFRKAVSFFYIFESFLVGIVSAFILTAFFVINGIFYPPDSYLQYVLFYLTYLFLFGVIYDIAALIFTRAHGFKFRMRDIFILGATILFDIFIYRFILMYIVMHGTIAYFFNTDWNKVERTGRDYKTESKPAA
ncbi:gamma-glutamyltransferase [Alteribacter keqinensis]|uniref:Glycosyltransferase n=1 Tax=Alteribacter keqinensis TaxID=2483800 RepID=A0A3M7TRD6_9BACI|nr:gamma-glutamyltransferase [Alteribacter keqinensis]RNA67749.1 glycosyltransferase [Alteribacter keqinensis]